MEIALDRHHFAEALCRACINWSGDESLVIALYGEWGSGKTSVKNMLLESLQREKPATTVIEFNPWEWSGRDQLFGAFFDEIGIAIGKKAATDDSEKLARAWKKYGAYLTVAGKVAGYAKMASPFLPIPFISQATEIAEKALKGAASLAEGAEKAHEARQSEENVCLSELKGELAASLSKLKAPILVVLDDVDRLTQEEIRLLFQLVKANADFPRMVYLLLFDRKVVENALDSVGGSKGREYMEKIIQVGFDIPTADPSNINDVLFKELNEVCDFPESKKTLDPERWEAMYFGSIVQFFANLRDVRRFISAFSFTIGVFYRRGALEVNTLDLIALEVLRIFEPNYYHALRRFKSILLGARSPREAEMIQGEIERLFQNASAERRRACEALTKELFPQLLLSERGLMGSHNYQADWMRVLRICHPELFDRYFYALIPKGDIPQSLIDQILSQAGDRIALRETFRSLKAEGTFIRVMERLQSFASEIKTEDGEAFVTAIFDVGDDLDREKPGILGIAEDTKVSGVVHRWGKSRRDRMEVSQIVLRSITGTSGLYLPVRQVALDERRLAGDDASESLLLTTAELSVAKANCLHRLEAAAKEGSLFLARQLGYYLFRWMEWDSAEKPRSYLAEFVKDPLTALSVLRGFSGYRHTTTLGSRVGRRRLEILLANIEPFIDVDRLKGTLGPILKGKELPEDLKTLSEGYREELAAFRRALERRERKTADDEYNYDDERA